MSVDKMNLLNLALDASNMRQRAISNNISNVNTANYKVQKVDFEDKFKKTFSKIEGELDRTHEKHLSLNGNIEDLMPELKRRNNTSVKENGNNVDVDLEMSEKAVNELYYNALMKQTNHEFSMINYVLSH